MLDNRFRTIVVEYAGEQIPVALEFGERRRLSISVYPDCSVTARVPADCSPKKALAHIQRRRSWIARQRRHFKIYHPLPEPKRFISGETHLYLGRQYRLKVHCSRSVEVKLMGPFFHIGIPVPSDPGPIRAALDTWYRSHAEPIFRDRMNQCLKSAPSLRCTPPILRIRRMSRRWGSCSRKGTITLNIELIKAPLHCIEYVIMHELCHRLIHDHSPAFFRLLGRCMPDWGERKARLEAVVLR